MDYFRLEYELALAGHPLHTPQAANWPQPPVIQTLYASMLQNIITEHYMENLQLVGRLLVSVDEAEPHGGGVGVEKLKLGHISKVNTSA